MDWNETPMRMDFKPENNQYREQTVYCDPAASASHDFIDELLVKCFVHSEDWKNLPHGTQERILACPDRRKILSILVDQRLLTEYQASRIPARTTFWQVFVTHRIPKPPCAGDLVHAYA